MIPFKPAQIIRFTYNHLVKDEETGDRFKEVFVLNPNWSGKMHGLDLKRMTPAEREVLVAVFDPKTKQRGPHKIPMVNDILRRMNPIEEIKNPMSFYQKFVKPFIRNKDLYRVYENPKMMNVTIVKNTAVAGSVTNPKPLFHKVETRPVDQAKLDLIKKVAGEKGVDVSKKVGQPVVGISGRKKAKKQQ